MPDREQSLGGNQEQPQGTVTPSTERGSERFWRRVSRTAQFTALCAIPLVVFAETFAVGGLAAGIPIERILTTPTKDFNEVILYGGSSILPITAWFISWGVGSRLKFFPRLSMG